MDEIFISYSSKDRVFVDSLLLEGKKNKGVNLWASHRGISSGEDFRKKIIKKINKSSFGIILVSKNSLESDFINQVELPALFNKLKEDKKFKLYLIFLENCNVKNNSFLKNYQFFNSPSTNLLEKTSQQLDVFYKELFSEILKNVSTKKYKLVPLLIGALAIALFMYITQGIGDERQINVEKIGGDSPVTTIENLILEKIDENNLLCYSEEISEVYINNFIDNPISESMLPILSCENSVNAVSYFTKELNITKEDLNDSLIDQTLTNSTLVCADSFKDEFGYSSNETLYDYLYIFVEDNHKKLKLNCFAFLKQVNSEIVASAKFTTDLIYLNIEEYRINYSIELKDFSDLVVGECFNYSDYFYGSKSSAFEEGLKNKVYSISCDYPHDAEIISELTYKKLDTESIDDIDDLFNSYCDNIFSIFYANLDEVRLRKTKERLPLTNYYFFYDQDLARADEEFRGVCLLANSYYFDIKVNYSYREMIEKVKFQEVEAEENFINISNCSSIPLLASSPEDDYYEFYDFIFQWNTIDSEVKKLYFYFEDYDYFVDYEYFPQTEYEKNILKNWFANYTIAPFAIEDGQKLLVKAELHLENGEILSTECSFPLTIQN